MILRAIVRFLHIVSLIISNTVIWVALLALIPPLYIEFLLNALYTSIEAYFDELSEIFFSIDGFRLFYILVGAFRTIVFMLISSLVVIISIPIDYVSKIYIITKTFVENTFVGIRVLITNDLSTENLEDIFLEVIFK